MADLTEFLRLADEYAMLPEGGTLLCAVSGGADSVCLLHILKTLAPARGFSVAAAHFNHGLRGEESDGDESFVRELAADWGVPFYAGRGDTAAEAAARGYGIEETARLLRYDFLRKTAQGAGAQVIATAHTADDNLETLLMRLARGTGLRGLAGIPPRRGALVRPFLTTDRAWVLAYLEEHRLPHREDRTNADTAFTRNRLRREVTPVLRALNPRLTEAVNTTTALLRADDAALTARAWDLVRHAETHPSGAVFVPASLLASAPGPVASRAAILLLERAGAGRRDLTAGHIASILSLAQSADPSAQLSLPGGACAFREYGNLCFSASPPPEATFTPVRLPEEGVVVPPGAPYRIRVTRCKKTVEMQNSAGVFYLCCAMIKGELWVRPRRSGDAVRFPGRAGTRSLKELFIDERVPRTMRALIPVFMDGETVAAVGGFGAADAYAARSGDAALKIEIEGLEEDA
ncbi:MAG TPA: tRNA lysidine(34) synthetase TilS [Oscillospiraceae bacterium]|nr:tRNA lysidine(34) synthetase TilS [Oscillospiraceae bacterium]